MVGEVTRSAGSVAEQRIGGRYEPIETIGRGGEAAVVKAVDTRHERLVALKIRGGAVDGEREDLLLEARALLSLPPHPALAHARDDLFDDGRHVLVLDWVDGVNLAQLLANEGQPGLPASSVLRWAAQAAEALTVLHQHGVVHGDVKPANLILDRTGRIVLVDLGSSSVPITSTARGGTPGFRAPEIAGGGVATRASDIFSLAATVFALLTGEPPTGGAPRWNGISRDTASRLEARLREGLAIDPARRPATPGELVERLRAGWGDETPTGVVTMLLTDVVGSTQLWERAPQRVPALLAEMQLVVDRAVEAHHGRRMGATVEGDTTVSAFPNAGNAVQAAIAMQRSLSSAQGVRVRAGLATGEVVAIDGEVLGSTVNRAARVRDLGRTGEIVLSGSTAAVLRVALPAGVELLALGAHELLGLEGVDDVAAVVADGVAAPPDPSRSPYPGLAPFGQDDADLFFGREDAVARGLDLLRANGFVAVIGASGSGKTSLALAGLAPHLPHAITVRPGAHPMDTLAQAGLAAHPNTVLIVDQLEELVTICRDAEERDSFVDAMNAHNGGLIVTLRADLYGEFGAFDEFAERLATSQVLLGPLRATDLARAVQEPAQRCGLIIEEGLPELIVAELGDASGTLPLLGHALREAWLRRDGRTITVAGYRASGGVGSAIAATAETALAALDDDETYVARRVLLRMVELRHDAEDTRRWASRQELLDVAPQHAADVVDTLVRARLVVVDRDQITLTHEALLRAWPRLGEWIAEERADLVLQQELRWATEQWDAGGRNDADLYRGLRLDAAVELADRERLPSQELQFVEAGREFRDREVVEERRRVRRLRTLVGIVSILVVVALVGGGLAVVQRNDAQNATRNARIEALVGRAESIRERQRDTAALLAVEAYRLADTARTRSTLFSTFTEGGGFLDAHRLDADIGTSGIVAADGEAAFMLDASGRLRTYDLDSGNLGPRFGALGGKPDPYSILAISDDGALVAQAAWSNPEGTPTRVGVYDTKSRALRFPPLAVDGPVGALAFTPGGHLLGVPFGLDARLVVVDSATGKQVGAAPGLALSQRDVGAPSIVAFGNQFVVGSGDGSLRYFESGTVALQRTIARPRAGRWFGDEHQAPVTLNQLVPVGDGTVITFGLNNNLERIDLAAGTTRWLFKSTMACTSAAVVPQRGSLYCGDGSGRLVERDLTTGVELRRLDAQNGNVGTLWPAHEGTELVSFSSNEPVVARWRLDGSGPITRLITPRWGTGPISPDSRRLLVERASPDPQMENSVAVVDAATGRTLRTIPGLLDPEWVDADTLGGATLNAVGVPQLARVDLDGGPLVRRGMVFDPVPDEVLGETGKRRVALHYQRDDKHELVAIEFPSGRTGKRIAAASFHSMSLSKSGDRMAVGTREGIQIFDTRTAKRVGIIPGGGQGAFITTADQLFVSSFGGELTQYDLETLKPIRNFGGSLGYVQQGVGTSDGTLLVTNSNDQSVALYDVPTGVSLGTPITIPDDELNFISLAPNGKWLAMGGTRMAPEGGNPNASAKIVDLDPEHWIDAACRVAGRNLTRYEWNDLIGNLAPYHATCEQFPIVG